jgi:hypothetical protein
MLSPLLPGRLSHAISSLDCQFINIFFRCFFESFYLIIYKTSKNLIRCSLSANYSSSLMFSFAADMTSASHLSQDCQFLNGKRSRCIKSENFLIKLFKISEISGRCLWVPIAASSRRKCLGLCGIQFQGVRTEAAG